MVGVDGVEPSTSSLSVTRSNQLSYTPVRGENGGSVSKGGPTGNPSWKQKHTANRVL